MPKARIAGVGMIPFSKPGQSADWDVMAEKAIRLALADAGISYDQRQVEGVRFGLQHNLGLGGACVVTLYGQAN